MELLYLLYLITVKFWSLKMVYFGDIISFLPSTVKTGVISFTVRLSIESKHEVTILGGLNEFVVKFYGPQGSK